MPSMRNAVRFRRWLLFAIVALALFAAALSNDVYNVTSPPSLTWHVVLRKFYSIVAFALVGWLLVRASGISRTIAGAAIAAYSGGIEIAQHLVFGHEPLAWNVVDVACGAVGGVLGSMAMRWPWLARWNGTSRAAPER